MKLRFGMQRVEKILHRSKEVYRALLAMRNPDGIKKLNSAEVLLVSHDVDRSLSNNGRAFSQLLDPVRNSLHQMNISTESISHPFSRLTGKMAIGDPKSINRSFLYASALEKTSRFLGLNISAKTSLWIKIFRSCEAKIILTIGADKAMCNAAFICNIEVVELLHGYRYSPIPWDYENRKKNELPTCILALDPKSHDTFSSLSEDPEYCQVVQHPMEEILQQMKEARMAEQSGWADILETIQIRTEKRKKVVLVCLQWGYGPDEIFPGIFPNQLFPEALIDVVDQTNENCIWIFRLHPMQLLDYKYKSQRQYLTDFVAARPHVFGSEFQNIPVVLLLQHVDCQLSPGSGTTAEALIQGVPSMFLDSSDYVRKDLENGYVEELDEGKVQFWNGTGQDLLDWIIHAKKDIPEQKQCYPKVSEVVRRLLEVRKNSD